MPEIIAFLAGRSVLVDEASKNVSVIGLLDVVNIPVSSSEEIPPDFATPFDWQILCWWLSKPDEHGKVFRQRVILHAPDSKEMFSSIGEFTLSQSKHRVVLRVPFFPIYIEGSYALALSVQSEDEDANGDAWQQVAAYTIIAKFTGDVLPVTSDTSDGE